MKRISVVVSAVLALSVIFVAFRADDDLFEVRKNFEIFGALYEEIAVGYVDEVRPQPFMRAGIEGMLEQLDPYTHFYDEADMLDVRLLMQRKLGRVSISLGIRAGRLTILAPEDNAEAYRQGLRTGDVVVKIGEAPADGLTVQEAHELLVGDPGSTIEMIVQRSGDRGLRSFVLRRKRVRTRSVSYSGYLGQDSTDGVAYVRLDAFGNRSGREVMRALRNMNRDVGLTGIILDLRDNPGGLLSEALKIVSLFVPRGSIVVSTRSRADGSATQYKTEDEPLFIDTPLLILINEYSASASEIVAGALQDHDRAVIMGSTSFGKGLVQIVRPLPHNTSLKMTTSHYFLPSGRTIHSATLNSSSATVATPIIVQQKTLGGRTVRGGVGVEPDIEHLQAPKNELERALERESAFFLFADAWVAAHCNSEGECSGSDEEMVEEFHAWLGTKEFSLTTDADLMLLEFEEEARQDGFRTLSSPIEKLREAMESEKEDQFEEIEAQIARRINVEVRARLLDERSQVEANISQDELIALAIGLLDRKYEIEQILEPN